MHHTRLALAFALASAGVACSDGGGSGRPLQVGVEPPSKDGVGSQHAGAGGSGTRGGAGKSGAQPEGAQGALNVRIQNPTGLVIELVTLQCAGDCAEVEAVARGGNPPYAYEWEDGSKTSKRTLCLETSGRFSVDATDTSILADEFHYAAQTVTAEVTATVLECVDGGVGGVPDAGVMCVVPDAGPPTEIGDGVTLPEQLTVDLMGAVRYFAGGAALPAGRYRLSYIDGCNTYGSPSFFGDFDASVADYGIEWSVHGSMDAPGFLNCSIVGDDGVAFLITPGTVGLMTDDPGAYPTYSECVAANCTDPPVDFDYAGGKLGLVREAGGALGPVDDLDGSDEGGRAPTFRLSRLDAAP